jgi:Mrp family chromosome partitioning ATPase
MVDADERMRGLTEHSGQESSPGLTDFALLTASLEESTRQWPAPEGLRLELVPAGSLLEDTAGFFRTAAFQDAIGKVRDGSDLVLVDSPPMLAVSDTSSIAAQADGIVLVVLKGTPLRHLEEVRSQLEFFKAPLLGYVFNRSDLGTGRYGYRYTYGSTPTDGD